MKTQLIYGTHPVTAILEHQPRQIKRLFVGKASKQVEKPAHNRSNKALNNKARHRKVVDKNARVTGVDGGGPKPGPGNQTDQPQRLEQVMALAQRHGISVEPVGQQWLDTNLPGVPHQRVVAEYTPPPQAGLKELKAFLEQGDERRLLLVLDNIVDPQNTGACLRVAAGMGVSAVVMPSSNSAGLTPAAHKAAAGAAVILPLFHVSNLGRALNLMKQSGIWIYGAAGEASEELGRIDFAAASAIVMGSEGSGLRPRTRELCDVLFRIPMTGPVQSFNVSVSAGISLYAVRSSLGK